MPVFPFFTLQLAFAGVKSLNRIQSRIFKTGFQSNENMLVCAPTGAGKTNIAMITVLREIGENMRNGIIQKTDFKVRTVCDFLSGLSWKCDDDDDDDDDDDIFRFQVVHCVRPD